MAFTPLRLFKSTSCWSPFRQRNTRLGIHHHQWRRCLLCCFLALILSWQKLELDRWTHCIIQLMVVLQYSLPCRGMVAKLWLITDDYGIFFVEVMVIFSYQLLRGEMMWILESLLKRSLCCEVQYNQKQHTSRSRFEMVRTRIFQTSGGQADWWISYWNLLKCRQNTLLWRYHTGISRSQITMDHYKWYFFV